MSRFERRRTVEEMHSYEATAGAAITQRVRNERGSGWLTTFTCGSLRRASNATWHDPVIGDLDLMLTSVARPGGDVIRDLHDVALPDWLKVTGKKAHGWLEPENCYTEDGWPKPDGRVFVDAWWTPWESVGAFGFFLTGPMLFNVTMRQISQQAGLMLTQYGLFEPQPKPTKTYPDRMVPGRRLDTPTPQLTANLVAAEAMFWAEWCEAVGLGDRPYPWPMDRKEVTTWLQGRSRAMRSEETRPG